jgi:hypothetical protein
MVKTHGIIDSNLTNDENGSTNNIQEAKKRKNIDFFIKQIQSRKNIGIDLIDILDDDSLIKEIHLLAEKQLARTLSSYSSVRVENSEVVFLSLVIIGMLNYDGNFYEYVNNTYSTIYEKYSPQKIQGLIRDVLRKFTIVANVDNKRTINNALHNALVPAPFLPAFFDFIYDIYKQNFEYELSENLDEDFRFVFDSLRNHMSEKTDEIKISVTKKTYKLIKSTKELINDEHFAEDIIKLSIIIVRIIDKYIWNNNVEVNNAYINQGFEEWIEKYAEENETRKKSSDNEIRSKWEPIFVLNNYNVKLFPQIHAVKNEYDYRKIVIEVFNGKNKIYEENEPSIKEIIGGYKIYPKIIDIVQPLGQLSYRLVCGDQILYDSKQSLFREVLLFSPDGKEIKNNSDYSGSVLICHSKAMPISFKAAEIRKEYYDVSTLNVKVGDSVLIGDEIINFSTLLKPGIIGEEYVDYSIVSVENGKEIKVYKSVSSILFENIPKGDASYVININGDEYSLEHFNYSETLRGNIYKYKIELEDLKSRLYNIKIIEKSGGNYKTLYSFDFALDKKLNVEQIKIDDETYLVSVESSFIKKEVCKEVKIKDYSEELFIFALGRKEYKYIIPFAFEMYRITDGNWHAFSDYLWIGDIKQQSILEVFGDDADELIVYSDDGRQIVEPIRLSKKGVVSKVPIGFLMSFKEQYSYSMLVLLKKGKRAKEIFCFNKCVIDKEKLEIQYDQNSKELLVKTFYHGRGQVFFALSDEDGNDLFWSEYLSNGEETVIKELESFNTYTITFKEKAKGLALIKEKELLSIQKKVYAWNDFVGKTFRIKRVYFDEYINGKFERKIDYFNIAYVTFIDRNKDGKFKGILFNRTRKNQKYTLNKVNPVEIEICGDVFDDELELAITKDRDGLLLDTRYHCVMNSLDEDAIDIYLYVIDTNGE